MFTPALMTGPFGEQWILFPSNLKILGKQNSLFPSWPVIKCLLLPLFYDKVIFNQDHFVGEDDDRGKVCDGTKKG